MPKSSLLVNPFKLPCVHGGLGSWGNHTSLRSTTLVLLGRYPSFPIFEAILYSLLRPTGVWTAAPLLERVNYLSSFASIRMAENRHLPIDPVDVGRPPFQAVNK